MYVTRRTLGQVDTGGSSGLTIWDWSFTLATLLFGGWLLTSHWKR
jgi:hypothetical protein